jgi:MFS family permease
MTVRAALLDVGPLRTSPSFRRLWIGTTTAGLAGQVATVAVLFQVWELTHSAAWVGAIGGATAVPTIVLGLAGGVLSDAVDRRRLVLGTSVGSALGAGALALQAAAGAGSLALVLALVVVQTACQALGAPARRTFVARLLPRGQVPSGVALNHVSFQAAMLVGPALGGLVLAGWGLTACYAVEAAGVAVGLYGVARLPAMRPAEPGATVSLRSTWDGWRFLLRRPVLRGAVATDLAATVLAMPIALFPVVNDERFGGAPETLGLLLSAIAVGGIVAGLGSGAFAGDRRPGAVMLAAAGTWGIALAGFGLVSGLLPTLACLAVAGAADTVAVISRGTVVQLATPDAYLGRVTSVEGVVGVGGPGIGNARAGVVAGLTSASVSAVTGGLACLVAVAVLAAANPVLRRWQPQEAERPPAVTGG